MIALLVRLAHWVGRLVRHEDRHDHDQAEGSWPLTTPGPDIALTPDELLDPKRKYIDAEGIARWTDNDEEIVPHPLRWPEDYADVDKLATVYGKTIPRPTLERWAADTQARLVEAQQERDRRTAIRMRLAEIEAEGKQPVENTGYIPVTGPKAGTDAKHGVVLPPEVKGQTTKEWADLKLELAYGKNALPRTVAAGRSGFSMRYLNQLRNRAEQRDPTLAAHDIAILRSRGLV